ncbi:MAG: DNA polymerase ligase N-terminal domain-containing protein, partial [Lysobacterales bacterium]
MALEEYVRKRKFAATPEPRDATVKRARKRQLSFVVQLHHARARHYDFRLEVDGVLRSWAVPKGPSFRPGEKRLAVEVEDHPISYASFEGDIPEGNYGAGHVAVFDRGTWVPSADPSESIEQGKLEFEMRGARLRGHWKLIRTAKNASKPQWLLFKRDDEFAGDFEADDLLEASSNRRETTPVATKGANPAATMISKPAQGKALTTLLKDA